MDLGSIVLMLALATLPAVLLYAVITKDAVDDRMEDPYVPKSTLAADGALADDGTQDGVECADPEAAERLPGRFAER